MRHIPIQSMVYKVMMYYRDRDRQESWISEMKTEMPQFVSPIDQLLLAKLKERQYF